MGLSSMLAACGGTAEGGGSGDGDAPGGGSGTPQGSGGTDASAGGSDGSDGSDGSGGSGGSGQDGTGGDAATGGSGGTGDASGAQALINPELLLDVLYLAGAGGVAGTFVASFRGGELIFEDETCVTERIGGCDFRTCSGLPPGHDQLLDAGAVDVSFFAEAGTASASIAPDASGMYDISSLTDPGSLLYGQPGTMVAAGGDYAAFTRDVEMPWPLVASISTGGAQVPVPGDAALTISWTPGDPGTFLLVQSPTSDPIDGVERLDVTCAFAAEAGQGTIDASFMSALPAGTPINTYTANLFDIDDNGSLVRLRMLTDMVDTDSQLGVSFVIE